MTQQEYENKIKELEKQIEELKMAKVEEPQSKRWKPKYGETQSSQILYFRGRFPYERGGKNTQIQNA